jgi:hypothetical protein
LAQPLEQTIGLTTCHQVNYSQRDLREKARTVQSAEAQ